MRTMRKFLVLAALLAVLPAAAAAATPDTTFNTFSNQACPTGSATFAVDVANPGSVSDTYDVSVNVPWHTVAPSTLELAAGAEDTAYIWLQPPKDMTPGTYEFTVSVVSEKTGERVTHTGQVEVLSCRAVDVSVADADKSVCRGASATYDIRVRNRGQAKETYDLSATHGTLSRDAVTLAPGASTTVTVTMRSSSAVQRTVDVTAESRSSYARDTEAIEFEARQCRDMELYLTPSDTAICEDGSASFEATITNTGEQQDTYTVVSNTGSMAQSAVTLEPGESRSVAVNMPPLEQGEHRIAVRASSQSFERLHRSQDATVTVENCYDLSLSATKENTLTIGSANRTLLDFTLENTGTRTNTYALQLDGPSWVDLRPQDTELQPGETGTAYLYVAPDYFSTGDYTATLLVEDDSGTVVRTQAINITVGNETVSAVTGEPKQRESRVSLVGRITGGVSGLPGLLIAVLIVGGIGYLFFTRSAPSPFSLQQRDYVKSADNYLDQNTNTVIKGLRDDSLSTEFLDILLAEEQQNKDRDAVVTEIKRQINKKERQ